MKPHTHVALTVALATLVATLAPTLSAQAGRPTSVPGGAPPSRSSAQGGSAGRSNARAPRTTTALPATLRLLARTDVQRQLGLTSSQMSGLSEIASAVAGQMVGEDAVRERVKSLLTVPQIAAFDRLLIAYLGYGALQFADVRAKLALTEDQEAAIVGLFAALATAKGAIANATTDSAARERAVATLEREASTKLAKVLTPEQDAALRALAA